jgi:hypothetical protein
MTTILGMIDDLNRTGRLLDFDIERCPDRSMQAWLTKRRAKLQETIGTLEARVRPPAAWWKTRWREPAGLLLYRLDSGLRGHNGRALGVLVEFNFNDAFWSMQKAVESEFLLMERTPEGHRRAIG